MKLIELSYKIKNSPPQNDWTIETVNFDNLNLIVGKNATGKTKLIDLFIHFSKMILNPDYLILGEWILKFENSDSQSITFTANISADNSGQNSIDSEELRMDKKIIYKRSKDFIEESTLLEENKELKISSGKLVLSQLINSNIQFVDIDLNNFKDWASNISVFRFGHLHGYEDNSKFNYKETNLIGIEKIKKFLKDLDIECLKKITADFNSLDYDIEYVKLSSTDLILKEKYLSFPLSVNEISQGMVRTISILILTRYLINLKKQFTLIIDDLAEGIDYDRATKLGKLLFDLLESSKIQLISTSNDNFLMNSVDIKYWTILKRENHIIKCFNMKTHNKLFEEFSFTGLSNFNLFSSNFLNIED